MVSARALRNVAATYKVSLRARTEMLFAELHRLISTSLDGHTFDDPFGASQTPITFAKTCRRNGAAIDQNQCSLGLDQLRRESADASAVEALCKGSIFCVAAFISSLPYKDL